VLRELTPQVLGAVLRRGVDFGVAEDAVQEALLAAAVQWPEQGLPDSPAGWLITVAGRKLADWRRRETARRPKEAAAVGWIPADDLHVAASDAAGSARDDSLLLLFLCCHPALPQPAQVALTLRAVGGLTTAEIARAFLVPETTMSQRITRGKRRIAQAGARFTMPTPPDRPHCWNTLTQAQW
jgi:RNA polymerase sigma factor (sigma-70 family)